MLSELCWPCLPIACSFILICVMFTWWWLCTLLCSLVYLDLWHLCLWQTADWYLLVASSLWINYDICCFKVRLLQERVTESSFVLITFNDFIANLNWHSGINRAGGILFWWYEIWCVINVGRREWGWEWLEKAETKKPKWMMDQWPGEMESSQSKFIISPVSDVFLPARCYSSTGTSCGPVSVTGRCSVERAEWIKLAFGVGASFSFLQK